MFLDLQAPDPDTPDRVVDVLHVKIDVTPKLSRKCCSISRASFRNDVSAGP